jgi:hypothetical protein
VRGKRTFPKHITQDYGDGRSFKSSKRQEAFALKRALDELRLGCAFIPGGSRRVEIITEQITALRQEISAKEWGR